MGTAPLTHDCRMFTILTRKLHIFKYLLQEGRSALHYAALNGFVECVQLLAAEGCEIDLQDNVSKNLSETMRLSFVLFLYCADSSAPFVIYKLHFGGQCTCTQVGVRATLIRYMLWMCCTAVIICNKCNHWGKIERILNSR